MRRYVIGSMLITLTLLMVPAVVWTATEKAEPEYVGAKKCKTCHKKIHKSWLETKHAKAFDVLSDEEKKKAECVGCHITGKTAKDVLLEGVQCEACHGPGSQFKSMKIMNKKKWAANPEVYKKKAIEAGLIYPTEENCKRCHKKEGNENFKPFDFSKRKLRVHPVADSASVETKKTADSTGK